MTKFESPKTPKGLGLDFPRIISAFRNEKALFALIVCALPRLVLLTLSATFVINLGFIEVDILLIACYLIEIYGITVAGVLIVDQAQDREPRCFGSALTDSFSVALKSLALGLGLGIALLAFWWLSRSLFNFCAISDIGHSLLTVLYPVLALVAILFIVSAWLIFWFVLPALWAGASIGKAVTIIRTHPAQVLTHLIVLYGFLFLILLITSGLTGTANLLTGQQSGLTLDFKQITFSAWLPVPYIKVDQSLNAGVYILNILISSIVVLLGAAGKSQTWLHLSRATTDAQAPAETSPAHRPPTAPAPLEAAPAEPLAAPFANPFHAGDVPQLRTIIPPALRRSPPSPEPAPHHHKKPKRPLGSLSSSDASPSPDILAEMANQHSSNANLLATIVPDRTLPKLPPQPSHPAICPQCGASLQADDVFCGHCGRRL